MTRIIWLIVVVFASLAIPATFVLAFIGIITHNVMYGNLAALFGIPGFVLGVVAVMMGADGASPKPLPSRATRRMMKQERAKAERGRFIAQLEAEDEEWRNQHELR